MSLLGALRPNTTSEKVFLLVLILSVFSGWPSIEAGEASLEPIMLGWLIGGLYMLFSLRADIIKLLTSARWAKLFAWALMGAAVALMLTERYSFVVLSLGFLATAGVFTVGLFNEIKKKRIRMDWLIDAWIYIASALAVVAIVQFVLGSFTSLSVLADGYKVGVFEFPRAHAFAQEPLYFANWLILPTLVAVFVKKNKLMAFLLVSALLLTLARGAFIAVAAAGGILVIAELMRANRPFKAYLPLVILPLAFALALVGTAAASNNSTFTNGVGRYLDHATLGVFNSEGASNVEPEDKKQETKAKQDPEDPPEQSFVNVKGLDKEGVVEASTLARFEVAEVGFDVFSESPRSILVGAGLYRFGEEANQINPSEYSKDLITNNQYIQVLAETGLIGFVLYFAFVGGALAKRMSKKYIILRLALVALLVQYLFFSNYTTFPFWVVIALILASPSPRKDKKNA